MSPVLELTNLVGWVVFGQKGHLQGVLQQPICFCLFVVVFLFVGWHIAGNVMGFVVPYLTMETPDGHHWLLNPIEFPAMNN